jgi:hypothetical protein
VTQVIDAKKYIIGAADVYSRPVGLLSAWTSVGATVDDVVFRINQTTINPSDGFNGITELIREMDYLSKASVEAEFTMPELSATNLALALRGALATVTPSADAGGAPLVTTLAVAAAVGDVNIKVVSVANAALGKWIRIETGAVIELRQITFVGTAGAGGTGLGFRDALLLPHANGSAVVETTGDGKTEITAGIVRRAPLTAYNDWALVAQSPTSYYELLLFNAISTTDSAEVTMGDETMSAIRMTLGTRRDGLNQAAPSWKIRTP